MDREIIEKVELKDGTEIRSYVDEYAYEIESPLAWDNDVKYYTDKDVDYNGIPTYDLEKLKDDFKGKRNVWVFPVSIQCGSCPGMYFDACGRGQDGQKLSKFNLVKFLNDRQKSHWNDGNSNGLLVFKAKTWQEAVKIAASTKRNMDSYLSGDVFVLDHGRETECEACGHTEWESMDTIGNVYLDHTGNVEQQMVETMGINIDQIEQ